MNRAQPLPPPHPLPLTPTLHWVIAREPVYVHPELRQPSTQQQSLILPQGLSVNPQELSTNLVCSELAVITVNCWGSAETGEKGGGLWKIPGIQGSLNLRLIRTYVSHIHT